MIVPVFSGGLGNQMFQIANSYACSIRGGYEFAVNYSMGQAGLTQGNPAPTYKNTIFKNIPCTNIVPDHVLYEQTFCYTPVPSQENTRYEGYFQSPKYFSDIPVDSLFHVESRTYPVKTIGLHVRRGDYMSKPHFHNIIPLSYYKAAIEMIGETDAAIVVFTDSPNVIEKEFAGFEYTIDDSISDVDAFYSMCGVDYLVGANSSFSWWAAYLGNAKKKIFPNRWFGPAGPQDYHDVYADDFTVIEL